MYNYEQPLNYIKEVASFLKKFNIKRFKQDNDQIYFFFPNCIEIRDKDFKLCNIIFTNNEYFGGIYYNNLYYFINNIENKIDVFDSQNNYVNQILLPWIIPDVSKPKCWIGDIFLTNKNNLGCFIWKKTNVALGYKIDRLQTGFIWDLFENKIEHKFLTSPECWYNIDNVTYFKERDKNRIVKLTEDNLIIPYSQEKTPIQYLFKFQDKLYLQTKTDIVCLNSSSCFKSTHI